MTKESFFNNMSLIIIGLGIGWLVGLSVTPGTTLTVITSIMTVVVLLITVVSGLESKALENEHLKWKVSPIPIALFVIGLVVGSSLGIYARTHNLLGVDMEESRSNLPKVVESTLENSTRNLPDPTKTILFASEYDECERLQAFSVDKLPRKVKSSTIKEIRKLPSIIEKPERLKQVLEVVCSIWTEKHGS